jgi:hypothetical protein
MAKRFGASVGVLDQIANPSTHLPCCSIIHGQASFVLRLASYQQSETLLPKQAVSVGLCPSDQFTTTTAINSGGFQVNRERTPPHSAAKFRSAHDLRDSGKSAASNRKVAVGS